MRIFFRDLWRLVKPFWFSNEKWGALALLAGIVGIIVGMVYLNVQFNSWYGRFYNVLQDIFSSGTAGAPPEERAPLADAFWREMGMFAILAAINVVAAVYGLFLRQLLRIRWRRWLTEHYLSQWLSDRAYYVLQTRGTATDNPDQRIQEDADLFVAQTESLTFGVLDAVLTLGSFSVILWGLSSPFTVPGTSIAIPGDMLWLAVAYAVFGTWLTHLVGRPLMKINYEMQKVNADFRYSMVRFRENVEGVALYGGEADEKAVFGERFGAVIENWWTFMWRIKKVTFLTASYGQTAVAFPFLINFGRLFNGSITLGTLMQISNSFGEVQKALSFFVGAYTTMADWKATVDRLTQFTGAIGAVKRENAGRRDIAIAVAPGSNELNVQDLDLALPQGQVLQRDIDLRVVPGDSVLVRGPSGAGKTTLFRAIAGLWPFGKGRVDLPAQGNTLFLPQKPYLPVGPLRMVVAYPAATTGFSDDKIREALTAVGLGHLTGRLDESRHWAQTLSVGEQQRIAFARALLLEPEWLYLDEATSQLDEDAEGLLYALLRKRLPQAAIVSIGHRHTLVPLHKRELVLAAPLTQLAAE